MNWPMKQAMACCSQEAGPRYLKEKADVLPGEPAARERCETAKDAARSRGDEGSTELMSYASLAGTARYPGSSRDVDDCPADGCDAEVSDLDDSSPSLD